MNPEGGANSPNFDRIARAYRWLEYLTLGPILERTRLEHLPALAQARHALILGDGDGRFTAALLARYPALCAEAVDLSPRMLTLLHRRAAGPRLRLHQADVRAFRPQQPPDLIVTHFLLDCLTQPEVDHLTTRLAASLSPGGLWLISEFRIPNGLLHWPARIYVRLLYLAFRILTGLRVTRLPDHARALSYAGLHLVRSRTRLLGLLTTELWQR